MTSMIVAGVDGLRGGRDAVALGAALAAADDAELLLTGVLQETLLPLPALMGPKAHPLEETEQMLLQTRAAHAPRAITRPLSSLSPMSAVPRRRRRARRHDRRSAPPQRPPPATPAPVATPTS